MPVPEFPWNITESILTLDQDLIIVNKPAGILVHPTIEAPDKVTLVKLLSEFVQAKVYPIHRLDRNTSGVMVFARSKEAAKNMQLQMNGQGFYKEYLTLVRDHFDVCTLSDRALTGASGEKQAAMTSFHPVYFYARATLIKAIPTTGRRHQIRRHLAHLGYHIIGDTVYGKGQINKFYRENFALPRMFLHSCFLSFIHPRTGKKWDISCPIPRDLKEIMIKLPKFQH